MAKVSLSDIRKVLEKVTGVSRAKDEEEQSYLLRIAKKVDSLADADWDSLTAEAQDWYNTAAESIKKKKDLPTLGEEEAAAPARRARAKVEDAEDAAPPEPKVGDTVTVTLTNNDVITGEITEIDEKNLVLDVRGEEEVFRKSKVKSIKMAAGKAQAKDDEAQTTPEAALAAPQAGDKVEVTLKDGEIITGKFIENDGKNVVVEINGEEEVFRLAKVDSVKVKAGAEKATVTKTEKAETKEKPAKEKPAAKEKDEPRTKPVTVRIREIICEKPDSTKEQVKKALDKEDLDVKDTTLDITYSEVGRTLALLREYGHLK